ncbi:MAG: DUF3524 domain-containing protein [Thermoplasmata archaeon]
MGSTGSSKRTSSDRNYVLYLEPFGRGSHKAAAESYRRCSRFPVKVVYTDIISWKKCMLSSALRYFDELDESVWRYCRAVVVSDLVDVAHIHSFLAKRGLNRRIILLMHENQLTYPLPSDRKPPDELVFKNLTSCLSADIIAWNSPFHRDSFLSSLPEFLSEYRLENKAEIYRTEILTRSAVVGMPVDIDELLPVDGRIERFSTPTIVWAARWDYDKNPEEFFYALELMEEKYLPEGFEYRVAVMGEPTENPPRCFEEARKRLSGRIVAWGFKEREEYVDILRQSHIFVSTAKHEFFGLAACEALACGLIPVFPDRLSYPWLLSGMGEAGKDYLYHSTKELAAMMAKRLRQVSSADDADAIDDCSDLYNSVIDFTAYSYARRLDGLCTGKTPSRISVTR